MHSAPALNDPSFKPGTSEMSRREVAMAFRRKAMQELAKHTTTFLARNVPAQTHPDDPDDAGSAEACCICGESHGTLEPVRHDQYDKCPARVHRFCIATHIAGFGARTQERQFKCPQCKQYLEGVAPCLRPRRCSHRMGGAFCLEPEGHLGAHVVPSEEETARFKASVRTYDCKRKERQRRLAVCRTISTQPPERRQSEESCDVTGPQASVAEQEKRDAHAQQEAHAPAFRTEAPQLHQYMLEPQSNELARFVRLLGALFDRWSDEHAYDMHPVPHVVLEGLQAWQRGDPFTFDQVAIEKLVCSARVDDTKLYAFCALAEYRTSAGQRQAFLLAMYTDPGYRGRGYAGEALQLATRYLEEHDTAARLPRQSCVNKVMRDDTYKKLYVKCDWNVPRVANKDDELGVEYVPTARRDRRATRSINTASPVDKTPVRMDQTPMDQTPATDMLNPMQPTGCDAADEADVNAKMVLAYAQTAKARKEIADAAAGSSSPAFLERVKTQNLQDMQEAAETNAFACVVCDSRSGTLVRFHQYDLCECRVHEDCKEHLDSPSACIPRCEPCLRKHSDVRTYFTWLLYNAPMYHSLENVDAAEEYEDECLECDMDEAFVPVPAAVVEETVPRKKPRKMCSTPLGPFGYCTLPKNHLGNCGEV